MPQIDACFYYVFAFGRIFKSEVDAKIFLKLSLILQEKNGHVLENVVCCPFTVNKKLYDASGVIVASA